jgi:hypothetical protein
MFVFVSYRRLFLALSVALALAGAAGAQNVTWRFEQLYSNRDLDVQFMVLVESQGEPNGNNQNSLAGVQLGSVHNDTDGAHDPGYVVYFTFPANLPSSATAGRRILIGTQAFADLGIITPDYIVENQFLGYRNGLVRLYKGSITTPYDVAQYAQIPTDGTTALFRSEPNFRPNLATWGADAVADGLITEPDRAALLEALDARVDDQTRGLFTWTHHQTVLCRA